MADCDSRYRISPYFVLECEGVHLKGNAFKPDMHSAVWGEVRLTWYPDEEDAKDVR